MPTHLIPQYFQMGGEELRSGGGSFGVLEYTLSIAWIPRQVQHFTTHAVRALLGKLKVTWDYHPITDLPRVKTPASKFHKPIIRQLRVKPPPVVPRTAIGCHCTCVRHQTSKNCHTGTFNTLKVQRNDESTITIAGSNLTPHHRYRLKHQGECWSIKQNTFFIKSCAKTINNFKINKCK